MPRKLSYKYLPTSFILFTTKPPWQGEKGRRRRVFVDFSWSKEAGGEDKLRQSRMRANENPCRDNRVLQQRGGILSSVMYLSLVRRMTSLSVILCYHCCDILPIFKSLIVSP